MSKKRPLSQLLQVVLIQFSLLAASQAHAGLWDIVKEQADKAKGAVDSLNDTLRHTQQTPPGETDAQKRAADNQTNRSVAPMNPATTRSPSGQYDRNQVSIIQRQLNILGYQVGSPDGIYGPGTRRGIEAFQRDHGLPQDGLPTSALRVRLEAEARSRRTMTASHGGYAAGVSEPPHTDNTAVNAVHSGSDGDRREFNTQAGGSGLVRPISPQMIHGKPLVEVTGVGIQGDAKRLLSMLVFNANPGVLDPPGSWPKNSGNCFGNNKTYECMLAHVVHENFDKDVSEKYLNPVRGTQGVVIWRSRDEFQLIKDQQAVVGSLVPELKKTASRYRFPVEIVIAQGATLGKYDFDKQAFPLAHTVLWGDPPYYTFPVVQGYQKLYLPTYEKPTDIKASPAKAESLRSMTGRMGTVQVLYTIELQGLEKDSIRAEVKSIELFSPADKAYQNAVYAYDNTVFNRTKSIAADEWSEGWEDSLNWRTKAGGIPDARYFLSAHAKLYGNGEDAIDTVVESYADEAIIATTPFERQRKKTALIEQFDEDEMPGLRKMLNSHDPGEGIYLAGQMSLGEYDFKSKSFPVNNIDVAGTMKSWYQSNQKELVEKYPFYLNALPYLMETPKSLSIDPALGETLYKKAIVPTARSLLLPVRIKAVPKPIKNNANARIKPHQALMVQYVPVEIEILDFGTELKEARRNRYLVFAEKMENFSPDRVIWRYVAKTPEEKKAGATGSAGDLPRIELADTRYMLTAQAVMMSRNPLVQVSTDDSLKREMKKRRFSKDAFENAEIQDREIGLLAQRVNSFDVTKPVWLSGKAQFDGYDFDKQEFKVYLDVHGAHTEGYPKLHHAQEVKPFVLFFGLPRSKAEAKRFSDEYLGGKTRGTLNVRLQAVPYSTGADAILLSKLLNGGDRGWSGQGYLTVVFQAKEITFLKPGEQSSAGDASTLDPRLAILTYAPDKSWEPAKK